MKKLIILFVLSAFLSKAFAHEMLRSLVPQPRQAYIHEQYSAVFSFNEDSKIHISDDDILLNEANYLNIMLAELGLDQMQIEYFNENDTLLQGIVLGVSNHFCNQLMNLHGIEKIEIDSSYPGAEGYVLDIIPTRVVINGSDEQGLRYGITTLVQILKYSLQSQNIIPCRIIDAPEFPIRWVYTPTNLQVGTNVDKLKTVWKQSAELKLNAALLTDYKWGFLSQVIERYYDSLYSVRDYAKSEKFDIVPGIFSFGYSNSILYHNPNLASGLPVRNQQFVIEDDTARLVPEFDVTLSNGSLEDYNGNSFSGFSFIDDPGVKSFVDTEIKHSGNASLRFENYGDPNQNSSNARIVAQRIVKPFTLYHMSAWVKTEDLSSGYITQLTAISKSGKSLNYAHINVPSTTDWKQVDITFNSLNNDTINIYWGTWSGISGKIWWDDLVFEEVAWVNLLRREGTPLNISHKYLDIAYIEGTDYDSLYDAKLGRVHGYGGDYDSWHQPPTFSIPENSAIQNGDTLIMSYYHSVVIHDSQVMCTMSDEDLYSTIENEFSILDSILKPNTYFMNHDEIRVMNWDYGDQIRGLTPAEILADNVERCTEIIHKYNPNAKAWTWSDMFDEYHNAKHSDYYLVNGDLRGSSVLMSKDIGITNWNSGNYEQSLEFFSSQGFQQISAPYYDQDENNIRIWKQRTQHTENFEGMLYTTWRQKYDHLEPFAEYSWNHAPYIYYTPNTSRSDSSLFFGATIYGDDWDKGWELDYLRVYWRVNPTSEFQYTEFHPIVGEYFPIQVDIGEEFNYIEYYLEAVDNRSWKTKIPFGDKYPYFSIGEHISNVIENDENHLLMIHPNPASDYIEIKNLFLPSTYAEKDYELEIYDVLGSHPSLTLPTGEEGTVRLNISHLQPGIYFVRVGTKFLKFVKI